MDDGRRRTNVRGETIMFAPARRWIVCYVIGARRQPVPGPDSSRRRRWDQQTTRNFRAATSSGAHSRR